MALPRDCREPALLQYREIAAYGRQIERLLGLFDRKQVLIELFDDFRRDPGEVYRRVLAFLELEDERRRDFPKVNEARRIRSPALARIGDLNSYMADLALRQLKRALGIRGIGLRAWLQSMSMSATKVPAPALALEEETRGTLREDVAKLSSLIGRDPSAWGF